MKKQSFVALAASAVLLAGCAAPYSEAPTATNFKTEQQKKLQSVSHWQLIAEDTSAQLVSVLPSEKKRIYVVQNDKQSAFQKAFNQQLISSLIAAGYPVMKHQNMGDTLTVEVKVDPVRFSENPKRTQNVGEATTLAGGLWVLRDIYSNVSAGAGMMAAAVGYDVFNYVNSENSSGKTPKTELLVTTTVSDNNRFYANSSNVYYTTASDWYNYTTAKPKPKFPSKVFELTGK